MCYWYDTSYNTPQLCTCVRKDVIKLLIHLLIFFGVPNNKANFNYFYYYLLHLFTLFILTSDCNFLCYLLVLYIFPRIYRWNGQFIFIYGIFSFFYEEKKCFMKPYVIILKINDKIHSKYRLQSKLIKTRFATTILQILSVSMNF